MRRASTLIFLAAALSLASWRCESDPVDTGEFALDQATVEGTIVAGGVPVSQATLRIRVLRAGCEGDPLVTVTDLTPDFDGSFRQTVAVLASGPAAIVACVEVVVTPFAGTGLGTATVQVDGVQFVRAPATAPIVEIEISLD